MARGPLLTLTLCALVAATSSCLSPTLPLPPPAVDSAVEGATGEWEIAGECSNASWVFAWNLSAQMRGEANKGSFTICSVGGTFQLPVEGKLCDSVEIWQETEDDSNASATSGTLLVPFNIETPPNPGTCPDPDG
jgi:hypothetical protein